MKKKIGNNFQKKKKGKIMKMKGLKKFFIPLVMFLNIISIHGIAYCAVDDSTKSSSIIKYFLIGIGLLFIVFILSIAYKLDSTASSVSVVKKKKNKSKAKKVKKLLL